MKHKLYHRVNLLLDKFADNSMAKYYLVILLVLVDFYLIASSLISENSETLLIGMIIFWMLCFFLLANTKKRRNRLILDSGTMISPYLGLNVYRLLHSPHIRVQRSPETEDAEIALVTWLYTCVLAISSAGEEKYNYHQLLVNTLSQEYPELLSWLQEFYEELKTVPPTPQDFSVEDFEL